MVSSSAFSFALELSSQGAPVLLIAELTAHVCRHVGCTDVPEAELTAALTKASSSGTFGGATRCDVQFHTRQRNLEILVSANGGRIWQTACAIP